VIVSFCLRQTSFLKATEYSIKYLKKREGGAVQKPLGLKLSLFSAVLVLVALGVVSFLSFKFNIATIENFMAQKVHAIAASGSLGIDGESLSELHSNIAEAETDPYWKKLKARLKSLKEQNQLTTDVYVLANADWIEPTKDEPFGQVVFVGISDDKPFELKGQKKEKYLAESFSNKKGGFTDLFTTVNGSFITGYAPILNSQKNVVGVLEVALSVEKELREARWSLAKSLAIAAGIALIIAIGFAYVASKSITTPIISLTKASQKMAGGDLSVRTSISTQDEIGILGKNFNQMAESLTKSYDELSNYSKNLERLVSERTAEVVQEKYKLEVIFDSINQGIFSVGKDLILGTEVSAHAQVIYEIDKNDLIGKNLYDALFPGNNLSPNDFNQMENALGASLGEPSLGWDSNEHLIPREIVVNINNKRKILELDWVPLIDDHDIVQKTLISVRDVTEMRFLLEKIAIQEKEHKEYVATILLCLNEPAKVESFISDILQRIDKLTQWATQGEHLNEIFRAVHTIKGNSRHLKLRKIVELANDFETIIHTNKANDTLLSIEVTSEFVENMRNELEPIESFLTLVLPGRGSTSHHGKHTLFELVGPKIAEMKSAFSEAGLTLECVSVEDQALWMDETESHVVDCFILHGLNNCIDHGFIRPNRQGFAVPSPRITIRSSMQNHFKSLEIIDNGVGNRILLKNLQQVPYDPTGEAQEKIDALVFKDGFTTATEVSDRSGRGVGLPAVKEAIEGLGGSVKLSFGSEGGAVLSAQWPCK
jgi:HAMP domain-containing protein/HPt (histidine-containing phosphotransfer) domain-containing protein